MGKYINKQDATILYLFQDSTYKVVNKITSFGDKWVYMPPHEIGFKNWQDKNRGNLDYIFGILNKEKVIFDFDNEPNNFFWVSEW